MSCLGVVGAVCGCCDPFIKKISECLGNAVSESFRESSRYLVNLKENLGNLDKGSSELKKLGHKVMSWVKKKEQRDRGGMQRTEEVEEWFVSMMEVRKKGEELLMERKQQCQKLCLFDVCSTEFSSTVSFAKDVDKCLKELTAIRTDGQKYRENNVAGTHRWFLPQRDQTANSSKDSDNYTYVGGKAKLDEVVREVEQHSIVGMIGTVGVGKTTLMERVRDHYDENPDFDVVIWIEVKEWNVDKIQESIRKQIGLLNDWTSESLAEKARYISEALQKTRFVLLVDGVTQSSTNLLEVGVPDRNRLKGSKVVFATRSRDVCDKVKPMRNKTFKVENLKDECGDALKLFREAADMSADSRTHLEDYAEQVAKKCGGLPYALINIGKEMRGKNDRTEWQEVINFLESPAKNRTRADKFFTDLKSAFEDLPDDIHKACFLYCALFSAHSRIPKNQLKEIWIFGDFWIYQHEDGEHVRMQSVQDYRSECTRAHDILRALINAGLLEEEEDGEHVKMHPVLRFMALWLANKDTLVLTEMPSQNFAGFKRVLFNDTDIKSLPEVNESECQDLRTLFLTGTIDLCNIASGFFQYMNNLIVLSLSKSSVMELPTDVKHLVALEYLDISFTRITQLPVELKELPKLKYFNVNGLQLEYETAKQVISELSLLQVLKMICDYCPPKEGESSKGENDEEELLKKLEKLKDLKALEIVLGSLPALKCLFPAKPLLKSTQRLRLRNFRSPQGGVDVSLSKSTEKLEELSIVECHFKELNINFLTRVGSVSALPEKTCCNITRVSVQKCNSLLDLTCLVLLGSLRSLEVEDCSKLKEIISEGKLNEMERDYKDIDGAKKKAFSNLLVLILKNLPELKSIYPKSTITMNSSCYRQEENCPKLKS